MEATCRYCGCTESRACIVGGDPCFWVVPPGFREKETGVCSNPQCLHRFHAEEPEEEIAFAGKKFLDSLGLELLYQDVTLERLSEYLALWHERRLGGNC